MAVSYLWRRYSRLRGRRTSNGFGANPITWQDLVFFQQLTGVVFKPWEVEIIEELDNLDRATQSRSLQSKPTADGAET